MRRFRFLLVALCTLTLASVAGATTPTETPASSGVCVPDRGLAGPAPADPVDLTADGSFCNKLCAYGFRCVPTPNGGVCVPDHGLAEPTPADPVDLAAGGSFCNKLCAYGFRCVPTPNGGVCVPDHGVAESAPADSTQFTPVSVPECGADVGTGASLASNGASRCGACTILCPYPLHLVQTKNCVCKCVENNG